MRLALIGMSGAGKTFWARRLTEVDYRHLCCDDLIAERLGLAPRDSEESISALSDWMGFPWEAPYSERARIYRSHEEAVVSDALALVESGEGEKVVLDTTGSVVYLPPGLLSRLRLMFPVLHLATPPAVLETMTEAFIARPTPLVWPERFRSGDFPDGVESLRRYLPELIVERESLYSELAHVSIPYETLHRPETTPGDLERIAEEVAASLDGRPSGGVVDT